MIQDSIALFTSLQFKNLDLLTVGITVAAIVILGFVVYLNNTKSITNQSFAIFCTVTVLWSFFNYINYQTSAPELVLWLLRVVIFLGVWHSFSFFQFCYVFPDEHKKFPKWYKFVLYPWTLLVSILTLSPLVFSSIAQISSSGSVSKTVVQNGIVLFVLTVIGLLIAGVTILIRKIRNVSKKEKGQYYSILTGAVITFGLLFTFNLILPGLFLNVRFIPLGAIFIFPFIAFTSYAIYRHNLFNVKVAAVSMTAFILTIFSSINIIYASQFSQVIINVSMFAAVLLGSTVLIRSILREIEQREKIEKLAAQLQTANDRLTDLNRQKSEFVSFASHQLRAPLTAMKGYSSLLLEGDMGELSKEARDGVSRIYDSTKTLVNIVDDYLNISRIELGTMKYMFETIDLKQMIEDVIAELRPNIEKTKIGFSFKAENTDGDYRINADKDKLKQVIANLVDNSLKYTPSGKVDVSLAYDKVKCKFVFKIQDTGIGIAPEILPQLFKKFNRSDSAYKINIKGTGLGLYVAKEMVEAHHGTIRAESEGEGKGSTFIVELEPSEKKC